LQQHTCIVNTKYSSQIELARNAAVEIFQHEMRGDSSSVINIHTNTRPHLSRSEPFTSKLGSRGTLEFGQVYTEIWGQVLLSRAVSIGQRSTYLKTLYHESRRLISFADVKSNKTKALDKLKLTTALQIDSRWEVSSDQLFIRCCINRLRPPRSSGGESFRRVPRPTRQ